MRRFLFILTLALLSCFPVRGKAASSVRVTRISAGSHITGDISVAGDELLIIEAGAQLFFAPGTGLFVNGGLRIEGEPEKPVVLEPLQEERGWGGIFAKCPATFYARNLQVNGLNNPLTACADGFDAKGIAFSEGAYPVLDISSAGPPSDVSVSDVRFTAPLQGSRVVDMGIRLHGALGVVTFSGVTFPPPLRLKVDPVSLTGTVTSMEPAGISYGTHCFSSLKKQVEWSVAVISYDSSVCSDKVIPVLFVPGYGASLNIAALSQPAPRDGTVVDWHFSRLTTPQYFKFFEWLDTNSIPHATAYYDWRLPAQESAQLYLKPALDALKARTGSDEVMIVAHSFGGILARTYIESGSYEGDVHTLAMIGTPNEGSTKAYSVWEGGVLPDDWKAFSNVIRLYQYEYRSEGLSATQAVRRFFPSVREMLPMYAGLMKDGGFVDVRTMKQRNSLLTLLNASVGDLKARTQVLTFAGTKRSTLQTLNVGSSGENGEWEDGMPLGTGDIVVDDGDGTVTADSVKLADEQPVRVEGGHVEIAEKAVPDVLGALYPTMQIKEPAKKSSTARNASDILWYAFDCPVTVTITSPSGIVYSSDGGDETYEVERSDAMTWMLIPREEGSYSVSITAIAETDVRWWVDTGPITELHLKQGETSTDAGISEPASPPPRQPSKKPEPTQAPKKRAVAAVQAQPSPPDPPSGGVAIQKIGTSSQVPIPPAGSMPFPWQACVALTGLGALWVTVRRWPP